MRKYYTFLLIILVFNKSITLTNVEVYNINNDIEIINLVTEFGTKLKDVSLLSSNELLKKSINENYKNFVTEELLNKWLTKPKQAPGRLTSSPWPERIEIINIKKNNNYYLVYGNIVEITSVEKISGGYANKIPITLKIVFINNNYKIDDIQTLNTT